MHTSRLPISIPSSSALVVTTASNCPSLMRASISRRSSGKKPARYALMRPAKLPALSAAHSAMSSVMRLERQYTMVRSPRARAAFRSAMAVVDGLSSGSMNTICRLPVGAPDSRMTGMSADSWGALRDVSFPNATGSEEEEGENRGEKGKAFSEGSPFSCTSSLPSRLPAVPPGCRPSPCRKQNWGGRRSGRRSGSGGGKAG